MAQPTTHAALVKGAATLSLAGLVFAASPAHEALADIGPFEVKFRQDNPLMVPAGAEWRARPALVDIDGDGDLDLFVGDGGGTIYYFENIGTEILADFEMRIGEDNPFWYENTDTSIDAPYLPYIIDYAAPAFADIDGDGDMDAFIGDRDGAIHYFENTGTASAPVFTERTGSDAMASFWYECGTSYYQNTWGGESTPAFVDIDADGDMDLFMGVDTRGRRGGQEIAFSGAEILFFENTGTATAPVFIENDYDNPLDGYSGGYAPTPVFVDIDGDGDMDAFVGNRYGRIVFFRNIGSPYLPEFQQQWGGEGHPLDGFDVGNYSAPAFGDIDGDGDMDALIGSDEGFVFFMKNTGAVGEAAFTETRGKAGPTWGFDVGYYSTPVFADIDGDGDLDAFSGARDGFIYFMKNTGDANTPVFEAPAGFTSPANPFYGIDSGWNSVPAFVDIDADGDLDAFVGTGEGTIRFYKNIGTATAPDFVSLPLENPAGHIDVGDNAAPTFVDIDGDGDMDLFVGKYNQINFYQNMGTPTAPDFTLPLEEEAALDNPLADVTTAGYAAPRFEDMDGDGDMDLLVGSGEGAVRYFEKTGTAGAPVFTEQTGTDNPLYAYGLLLEEGLYATVPCPVDIDDDGDIDLFVGEYFGRFLYFENTEIEGTTDGDTTPVVADDDDTCFINSLPNTAGHAKAGVLPFQKVKNLYASLVSFLR